MGMSGELGYQFVMYDISIQVTNLIYTRVHIYVNSK